MAPPRVHLSTQNNKNGATNGLGVVTRRGTTTRSQAGIINPAKHQSLLFKDSRVKRKAEASPLKDKMTKRSALGNITNAIKTTIGAQVQDAKKIAKKVSVTQQVKSSILSSTAVTVTTTKPPVTTVTEKVAVLKVESKVEPPKPKPVTRVKQQLKKEETEQVSGRVTRKSVDLEKSEDNSLYVSALEEVPDSGKKGSTRSANKEQSKKDSSVKDESKEAKKQTSVKSLEKVPVELRYKNPPKKELPEGVEWDFDAENWSDSFGIPQYAMDIFNYLKERESNFPVGDYIEKQVCLSRWMRSLLVDWMVAVQESFELNHETLYLAVKLVDLYLTKVTVGKETLQLLGAASLFIASKFDERIPPMIDDFLYICDGAYTQRELLRMEMSILKIMDFDIGIPLSYRFLRRYARCAKVSMPTLTLARYILEYSLMDYSTIRFSDSKMAASALFLALQMKDLGGWNATLEYYSGYKLKEFADVAKALNDGLHRKQKDALTTVRNKYSHKIFFEVAKVPLKDKLDL